MFCIGPHGGRQMFLPVDSKCLRHSYVYSPCVRVCFSCDEHLKHKHNGRPRGRLHSDTQVSTRARKHQKLYGLAIVCVTTQGSFLLSSLLTYYL